MLALHGWGRTHADFDTALADLVESGACSGAIALDLPGFGASPAPPSAGGAAAYADLIEPALDDCAARVVVVGHSFGGRIAVELAVRQPERVASLVLCGVPLLRRADRPATQPALRYRLARRLHRRGLLSDAAMESIRRRFGSADYRNASGVMRDVLVAAVNESYETHLGTISQPVELLWGLHDDAVPVATARRAHERLSESRLTVLDEAGHFVPTEAALALSEVITRRIDAR